MNAACSPRRKKKRSPSRESSLNRRTTASPTSTSRARRAISDIAANFVPGDAPREYRGRVEVSVPVATNLTPDRMPRIFLAHRRARRQSLARVSDQRRSFPATGVLAIRFMPVVLPTANGPRPRRSPSRAATTIAPPLRRMEAGRSGVWSARQVTNFDLYARAFDGKLERCRTADHG